jgi:hypothetical protein
MLTKARVAAAVFMDFLKAAAGQCAHADLCGCRWPSGASGKVGSPVCRGTGGEAGVVLSATVFA